MIALGWARQLKEPECALYSTHDVSSVTAAKKQIASMALLVYLTILFAGAPSPCGYAILKYELKDRHDPEQTGNSADAA
jgi:hypothetical protein